MAIRIAATKAMKPKPNPIYRYSSIVVGGLVANLRLWIAIESLFCVNLNIKYVKLE